MIEVIFALRCDGREGDGEGEKCGELLLLEAAEDATAALVAGMGKGWEMGLRGRTLCPKHAGQAAPDLAEDEEWEPTHTELAFELGYDGDL